MAKSKTVKLKPFQKILTIMISGKPITKDELDSTLGKEIQMYRISTYMWHVKTFAGGVVKSIKDGRKVTAYQLMNVEQVQKYMKDAGITVSQVQKEPVAKKSKKLADMSQQVTVTETVATKQPEVVSE